MRRLNERLTWLGTALLATALAAAPERLTVLVEFDPARTGPATACDGSFQVDRGTLRLRPWLHDGQDAVDGPRFRLATAHDAASAQAAKLRTAYRSALPKGLLIEFEGPIEATLAAETALGAFTVPCRELRDLPQIQRLDGKVCLQRLPTATRLGGDQAEEEYPSIAVLPDGRTAVAFVAWDGTSDRVMLRLGDAVTVLTDRPGDYLEPRCAVDGQGVLWVVWAANDGQQWDLFANAQGRTQRLTTTPRNDFWPRLARDPAGRLWLAWQTVGDDRHYEVMLGRLGADGLAATTAVSEHPHDDWEPALCATADGRLVVAWDTYRNGSFDIYLREFALREDVATPLGPARPVAASARREAHVTVAADSRSRVWLAWDVGVPEWGKHPTPRGTLHSGRETDLACYDRGRFQRPSADLAAVLPDKARKFVEYPQVIVDRHDRLWVLFRVENEVRGFYKSPQVKQNLQNYGMWLLYASRYAGNRWSSPMPLPDSSGRQDMRADAACGQDGEPVVAYGTDGRTARLPYVPVDYDVQTASLAGLPTPPDAPESLRDAADLGAVEAVAPDAELAPLPRNWTVGGQPYLLLLGDTHRHTDISRCANGYDGSLQDAYRYALDAAGLDWLAISDHDQDILKHRADRTLRPRQDYDWWRSQKYSDLYSIPGRFAALYGYEHGGSYRDRGGHKNIVLSRRGLPVQEVDAPRALFAALADSGAIAIPHQLADAGSRMDWEQWNADYERVGEVFQARGSYEFEGCPRAAPIFTAGNSMWDALAKGVRIGIIASSDHGQTHQARAGVYVDASAAAGGPQGWTRDSILTALKARRAFGATVAAALQVAAAEQPMGQELLVDADPRLTVRVAAPVPISRVEVVREQRFVYSTEPQATETSFLYVDTALPPGGSTYYYVRATIGRNDFAWSSPLWVTRRP